MCIDFKIRVFADAMLMLLRKGLVLHPFTLYHIGVDVVDSNVR